MSTIGPPPLDPRRNRFLFPSHMKSIQRYVARLGMVDDIEVLRRTPVDTSADPATDYGDDQLDFIETSDSRRHYIKGWIYSTPTRIQQVDTGAIITVNTYTLRCPWGTDIHPGDEVIAGGETYTVSDTTHENTWSAILECTLRHRE